MLKIVVIRNIYMALKKYTEYVSTYNATFTCHSNTTGIFNTQVTDR